jgi:hypothetical protein
MAGGLLQLLAKGAQDHILVGNPQITHFRNVFRRYTNFSMETMRLETSGNEISQTNNNTITAKVKRDGDLVSKIYFNFETPNIYSGADSSEVPYEFKWVENIGHNVINEARLIIGSTEIEKHDNKYFDVYSQLRYNNTKKQAHDKLIGNVPELNNPSIGEYIMIPVIDNQSLGTINSLNSENLYNAYSLPVNNETVLQATTVSQATLHADELDAGADNYFTDYYIKFGNEVRGHISSRTDANTYILDENASATNDIYNGMIFEVNGEQQIISDYTGGTKTIDLVDNLTSSKIGAGTPYRIVPITRKILTYTTATKIVTFETLDVAPNVAVPYNIYKSNGQGMKVSIKRNDDDELSFVNIEQPGHGYKDGERMYIDIDGTGPNYNAAVDPAFFILWSNYPHTRYVNTNSQRQYSEITDYAQSSVTKHSVFNSIKSSMTPSIPKRKIKVPMNFFFCHDNGCALPLIALQYHEVTVELTLRTIPDLFTIMSRMNTNLGNNTTVTSFNRRRITDSIMTNFITQNEFALNYYMEATYIFLDGEERRRFAMNNHDYLIQEVQTRNITAITDTKDHELTFYHPVKEIVVVPQRSDMANINQWNNYTNWLNDVRPDSYEYNKYIKGTANSTNSDFIFYNKNKTLYHTDVTRYFDIKYFRKNIINNLTFRFNGQIRENVKDNMFFNNQVTFDYHKTNPKDGINVYSFSVNPNEFQPSGACNFSRISTFQINIDLGLESGVYELPLTGGNPKYSYNFSVYAINYNILKIASGMGSKQFAN